MSIRCLSGKYPPVFAAVLRRWIPLILVGLLAVCGGDGREATGPEPSSPERVFIASTDSTLTVFDVAQEALVATVKLPGRPSSVAISPAGRRVFVGLVSPGGIVEIDAVSLAVLRVLPAPSMGLGLEVTADGSTIVGTNQGSGLVTILSLASGSADTIRVGLWPQYLRLDRAGRNAYVSIFGNDALAIVNVPDRSVEGIIPLGPIEYGPTGVALSADGGTAFVGTYSRDPYLQVVDLASRSVTSRVDVGWGTVDVDLTADGRGVLLGQAKRIVVVDATTATMTGSIAAGAFALAVPQEGEVFFAVQQLDAFPPATPDGFLHVIGNSDHAVRATHQIGHLPVAVAVNFPP